MTDILSLQGRASRSDWWITTISGGVVAQIGFVIAIIARFQETGTNWLVFTAAIIGGLVALWTTIAVTARRFRDRGDSPWMTLLLAIPVLGEIWILIVCGFLPSPNQAPKKLVVRSVTNGVDRQDAEHVVGGNGG
jgi:uncharacterized membrane protein YhaH (DUF805 family)